MAKNRVTGPKTRGDFMNRFLASFLRRGKEGFVSLSVRFYEGAFSERGWRCVDATLPFFGGHLHGFGSADFLEAREVPSVRKIAALVRLDGLDAAVPNGVQEAARPVGLI
jgi:hypothetical protein